MASTLVERFLDGHAAVGKDERPVYVKGVASKLSREEVAEIVRLRGKGETLRAIAERYEVDESYISRIVSGERLAKFRKVATPAV
jgi:hypothetical protein